MEATGHNGRQEYKAGKNGAKHNHNTFKTKVGLQEVYKEHGGRKGGREVATESYLISNKGLYFSKMPLPNYVRILPNTQEEISSLDNNILYHLEEPPGH